MLMYAARYADVGVFQLSCAVLDEVLTETEATRIRQQRDDEGRNLLHHAAEAGNDQMLGEVTYGAFRWYR